MRRRTGQAAAERLAALAQVLHLRASRRAAGSTRRSRTCSSLSGSSKRSRNAQQRVLGHLLGLVGDHLALAGDAHPVALDRLREDHGRLPLVADGRVVGGVDLLLVEPAAVEQPDLLVGHVRDALEQHRVAAEEVLAHVGAVAGLERLVFAVDALLHHVDEPPVGVRGEQRIPARAPDHLDHVPAGAAEVGLELLDDLAVAAHRAVEALQVAVDDPDQVVEPLAAGEPDRAHRLGLVHLAVAEERPHLASGRCRRGRVPEVLHEARLVDRRDRADPERHGRELPEVGHQPGVRIGAQTGRARDLLAEPVELLFGEPALEEGAGVVARRGVALEVDEVATVAVGGSRARSG